MHKNNFQSLQFSFQSYNRRVGEIFCIPITCNNPTKAEFSNKKKYASIQTRPTQIVNSIFLIQKPVSTGFLKIISV